MSLLADLLATDGAAPRLTVYAPEYRLDFSAQTLDNWAAKVANMLVDELDLAPGDPIALELPATWQHAVIVLGALTAGVDWDAATADADVIFAAPGAPVPPGAVQVVVIDDAFGLGAAATGIPLPAGALDFAPTARMYGDVYYGDVPTLADLLRYPSATSPTPAAAPTFDPGSRVLSRGWNNPAELRRRFLEPIAAGGSAVIVTDPHADLDAIAAAERVTVRL